MIMKMYWVVVIVMILMIMKEALDINDLKHWRNSQSIMIGIDRVWKFFLYFNFCVLTNSLWKYLIEDDHDIRLSSTPTLIDHPCFLEANIQIHSEGQLFIGIQLSNCHLYFVFWHWVEWWTRYRKVCKTVMDPWWTTSELLVVWSGLGILNIIAPFFKDIAHFGSSTILSLSLCVSLSLSSPKGCQHHKLSQMHDRFSDPN